MTTYVPLQIGANASPPWKGQFTLDGAAYQGVVTWNVAAQRWYLSLPQVLIPTPGRLMYQFQS